MNSHVKAPIQQLTPEIILQVALFLPVKAILELGLTCQQFADCVRKNSNDLVFRRLIERDYGITYKRPDQTWFAFFKDLYTHSVPECCPHLSRVPNELTEAKRVLVQAALKNTFPCELCHQHDAAFLTLSPVSNTQSCRACLLKDQDTAKQDRFPIWYEWSTEKLWCSQCKEPPHEVGGNGSNEDEQHKVKEIVESLKNEISMERRRKAEHLLYIQELRREDMSGMHYLVEKNWARAWMLFRIREGSPLPGKITNNKLTRSNGSLDPSIRLPNDKYRPAPETHADIVSERLWSYLSKAYGVQGRVFSEDDLRYPEYTRLRGYINDFKKSILSYP